LQGRFAVFGGDAKDEVGEAVIDEQVPSEISMVSWNSFRYPLQVSGSQVLERLIVAEERQAVCELEAVFVSRDGGGEVLLIGGGIGIPRSLDIFSLTLCRAEERLDALFCHCPVEMASPRGCWWWDDKL
jgi:hypothetical protein